ncbi:unnamed protein product [Caenorhabditis bovis]|uniref:Cytochrome P450 n=1 Tax=Caenorhabditis bovis TaxID=2654633 RepID=A0A8S1EWA3_9PELO|nr:unnamed protein product [Caenorhabditis bovis]
MRTTLAVLAEAACPVSVHFRKSTSSIPTKKFSEIPGPREIPFIGSIDNLPFILATDASIIEKYSNHLLSLYTKYGNIVKENLGFGRKYVVHIFDPVDVQKVLSADGKTPFIVPLQETTLKYREMKGMNPGLGNLNGGEWYRLRSAIQQAMMRPQSVQTYLPFSNKVSNDLVDHVQKLQSEKGFVDMQKVAGRWSLESAGQILFEKSLGAFSTNSKWADDLISLNKEIFQLSAKMRLGLPLFRIFSTPSWKKMVALEDKFYGEVDKLMDNALDSLTSNISENAKNEMRFASYLINRKELNRNDIKVILLSMFSDGLSTTAPMLIYNLFNLAKNPEIQKELREEIRSGNSKSPFLRACIKETFRLFPIGTEISRISQRDLVLSGYEIPSGTAIDINTNIIMRHPAIFADSPMEYKPSRLRLTLIPRHRYPFFDLLAFFTLNLSLEISNKAVITEILVSKGGHHVLLIGPHAIYVIRINPELLITNSDRLSSEYFCSCFSLHESLLVKKSTYTVVQVRYLPEKIDGSSFIAVLFSDDCIRFYDLNNSVDSTILRVDFRQLLFDENDSKLNNTLGLHKSLVSFDLKRAIDSSVTLIAVDSEAEFYGSIVYYSCFTEGVAPMTGRIGNVDDALANDPISIKFINTANEKVASVLALLSSGNVISHLVAIPDEFGWFELLLQDQIKIPTKIGCAMFVENNYDSRYCASEETVVYELVSMADADIQNTKTLKSVSISLLIQEDENEDDDWEYVETNEVMHLIVSQGINETLSHIYAISSFIAEGSKTEENRNVPKGKSELEAKSNNTKAAIEQALSQNKPLSACICVNLHSTAQMFGETQQTIDDQLVQETKNVEDLKLAMFELKNKATSVRKQINVLISRVEDNVPLSKAELRIFDRLQHHQNCLSQMSIQIPKITLEVNEQKRVATTQALRKNASQPNKFANVEKK